MNLIKNLDKNHLLSTACWRGIKICPSPQLSTIECSRSIKRKLKNALAAFGITLIAANPLSARAQVAENALPSGANVVVGDISISTNDAQMNIIQQQQKGIINWNSFNIGENAGVDINNSGGFTLNRVVTNDPSQILGSLTSNGQVMLINQNGIVYGANSRVDVNGLISSTADIKDSDFLAGNYHFNTAGKSTAQIINEGNIQIKNAGLAAFVAPTVINNGIITANLGKVSLASGDTWILDMGGLVKLEVGDKVAGQLVNKGNIKADGGIVQLTANQVQGFAQNAITVYGDIQTQTVDVHQGAIIINGGDNGIVEVAGTLDASGDKAGAVHVTGNRIMLTETARLDATGVSGGGEVLIGGEYLGGAERPEGEKYAGASTTSELNNKRGGTSAVNGSVLGEYLANYYKLRNADGGLKTAQAVVLLDGSSIDVSALENGDAGRVIVWSDEVTRAHGSIKAKGGLLGGDGGFVETSSKDWLDVNGILVDRSASDGEYGTWLIDPSNITINDSGLNANIDISGNPWIATGETAIIFTGTISDNIGAGAIEITTASEFEALGNIALNADLTYDSIYDLTLTANNNITLNRQIQNTNTGGLVLTAGNNITFGSYATFLGTINGTATETITVNQAISGGSGITLDASGYELADGLSWADTTDFTVGAGAFAVTNNTFNGDTTINFGDSSTFTVTGDMLGGTTNNLTLSGSTVTLGNNGSAAKLDFANLISGFNKVTVTGSESVSIGAATIYDPFTINGTTTVTGAVTAGTSSDADLTFANNTTINSEGSIDIQGSTAGNVTFQGTLKQNAGSLTADRITTTELVTLGTDILSTTWNADSINVGSGGIKGTGTDLTLTGGTITLTGETDIGTKALTATGASLTSTGKITTGAAELNVGSGNLTIGSGGFAATGNSTFTAGAVSLEGATTLSSNSLDINANTIDTSAAVSLGGNSTWTGTGAITISSDGITNGGNLTVTGTGVTSNGSINVGENTLKITANNGNINHTSGTLTADKGIFNSSGTQTANVAFSSFEFGHTATGATFTGTVMGQNGQAAANKIVGGPSGTLPNSSYTFNGRLIGDSRSYSKISHEESVKTVPSESFSKESSNLYVPEVKTSLSDGQPYLQDSNYIITIE